MKTMRKTWLYIAILSFGVYFISCGEEPPAPTPVPRVMVTTPSGEQVSKPMAEKPLPDKPVVKPPRPQPQLPRWQCTDNVLTIKDAFKWNQEIYMHVIRDNRNDQEYMVFTNKVGEYVITVVPVIKGTKP